MLELFKKYQKTAIIVGTIVILLVIGVLVYLTQRPQATNGTADANTSESATREHQNETQQGDPNQEEKINRTFNIGEEIQAGIPTTRAQLTYHGTITDTYPETGTVLMAFGNWHAVVQFSYTDVIDIKTKGWSTSGDDETAEAANINREELTIRAVKTRDGRIIVLRNLGAGNLQVDNAYKIIDLPAAETNDTFDSQWLYMSACSDFSQRVLDFLAEHNKSDACSA